MPPIPKPNTGAAKKGSRSKPSTGTRDRESDQGFSSAPPIAGSRSRTTKVETLQSQLARMYMMIGTMIVPFGRFYPVLEPVGTNLRNMSNDAAEAWMDLAAKDKRVLEILESITGASTWGNVIGIHLAIFASALPGSYMQQVASSPPIDEDFMRQGRAMGMSDEEIAIAAGMVQGGQMPARDTTSGGPGDTVSSPSAPEYSGEQATATAAPPVSRSGIVSPEQLGVTQVGPDGIFPADAQPPNGTGVVS